MFQMFNLNQSYCIREFKIICGYTDVGKRSCNLDFKNLIDIKWIDNHAMIK